MVRTLTGESRVGRHLSGIARAWTPGLPKVRSSLFTMVGLVSDRVWWLPCGTRRINAYQFAAVLALSASFLLSGPSHASDPRLPRLAVVVVTPRLTDASPDLAITGSIQARIQASISFNTNGKVTARRVEVGEHVTADTVLATLDPAEQQADVSNAEAALASARAQLQQADLTFQRQRSLISGGFTTRTNFDQAQEALATSQSQVRAAQAALNTAREQLSYTTLRAGQDGIIVSQSVEVGQVVQTGQAVFVLARDGQRDAVFNVPEAALINPPATRNVDIFLQADPEVRATGEVREISPILDPATDTVTVKVGIAETPPRMTLGAAVVGRGRWEQDQALILPWSALFAAEGRPAVWVLDKDDVVSLRPVTVRNYETGQVYIGAGLEPGQRVVARGGQLLVPGQKVRPVEGAFP